MNKLVILLSLASVVIISVMVYLAIRGVQLRERTLIKWSKVEGSEQAGAIVMRRLFPVLKEHKNIEFDFEGSFGNGFVEGFQSASNELKDKLEKNDEVESSEPEGAAKSTLTIRLLPTPTEILVGKCRGQEKDPCLAEKAQRKWMKKQRDPNKTWIFFQRIADKVFYLYYTEPGFELQVSQ